jgi:hypothetical protein
VSSKVFFCTYFGAIPAVLTLFSELGSACAATAELFQATKLATNTLREHGKLLRHNQANTLNNFLQATRNYKKRNKITQGQCFKIMNIAKQAQRLCAKLHKKN